MLRLLTQAELETVARIDGFEEPIVADYARQALEADPEYPPWGTRLLLLKPGPQAIGHIRFQYRPINGTVEFGYTVFTPWRNRGYATEAAEGIMSWPVENRGMRHFVTSVRPNNAASQRVVAKLGFREVAQHLDEIDGIEDILHPDR